MSLAMPDTQTEERTERLGPGLPETMGLLQIDELEPQHPWYERIPFALQGEWTFGPGQLAYWIAALVAFDTDGLITNRWPMLPTPFEFAVGDTLAFQIEPTIQGPPRRRWWLGRGRSR